MMLWTKPGGRTLSVSIALLVVTVVLAGTPLLWILGGRQSENYPELAVLTIGVPISVVLVLVAAIRFWRKNRATL
jgi:uncharacterized membrane protein